MIIVECYLDEFVVHQLGVPLDKIKHQPGKGRVLNALNRQLGKIGVIDEDPKSIQPQELANYDLIEEFQNLKLLSHINLDNTFLIIIPKDLEHWIVHLIKKSGIKAVGIPLDPKKLHSIPRVEKNRNFRDIFSTLLSYQDEEIKKMIKWLSIYY